MFSGILRKLSSFARIPFTFTNWLQVMGYALSISFSPNLRHKAGFVTIRGGLKLKMRLSNTYDIGSTIETYNRKVYLPPFIKVSDNARIVDIGASIGDFSILCASLFKDAIILSYEPNQAAFELLRENIHLNHLENKIRPYLLGVSGISMKANIGGKGYDSTSLKDIFKENKIERCDLLKMDCEGMEYGILLNTPKEILQRINAMAMECHIFDKGEDLRRLRDYLTGKGFTVITTKVNAHNVCYLYGKRE